MAYRKDVAAAIEWAHRLAAAGAHFRALPTAVHRRAMARPRLLLQAIVTKEQGDVDERDLQQALVPAWRGLLVEVIRNGHAREEAAWPRMAEVIANAYDEEGWDRMLLTQRAQVAEHGGGRHDLLVARCGFGSIRFINQAVVCSPPRLVGVEDIGVLLDALSMLPAGSNAFGIVSTTAHFRRDLYDHARVRPLLPDRLALRNRLDVLKWLKAAALMQDREKEPASA